MIIEITTEPPSTTVIPTTTQLFCPVDYTNLEVDQTSPAHIKNWYTINRINGPITDVEGEILRPSPNGGLISEGPIDLVIALTPARVSDILLTLKVWNAEAVYFWYGEEDGTTSEPIEVYNDWCFQSCPRILYIFLFFPYIDSLSCHVSSTFDYLLQ